MAELDRQTAFSGTRDVAERLRFDAERLEAYLRDQIAGLCRADRGQPVQGRPIQSDLSRRNSAAALRAAAQAAGKAVAFGACRRPRIPRHQRALSSRISGRRAPRLLRRRGRYRHGVLRHGLCRGPRLLGTADAGVQCRRTRTNLRRHECDAGAAAQLRSGQDRTWRLRPRRELRGAAGGALVETVSRVGDRAHRGYGAPDRLAAGAFAAARSRRASCTAITGSTT